MALVADSYCREGHDQIPGLTLQGGVPLPLMLTIAPILLFEPTMASLVQAPPTLAQWNAENRRHVAILGPRYARFSYASMAALSMGLSTNLLIRTHPNTWPEYKPGDSMTDGAVIPLEPEQHRLAADSLGRLFATANLTEATLLLGLDV